MCAYGIGFFGVVKILHDKVVLRDSFKELIHHKNFLFGVNLHLQAYKLKLSPLQPLAEQPPIPQLAGVEFKLEDHHAVLPALEHEEVRRAAVLQGDENVICGFRSVLREGGSEILAVFVSDGVVRLLYAVVMQDLHAAHPDVKKLGHQVILLSHPANSFHTQSSTINARANIKTRRNRPRA